MQRALPKQSGQHAAGLYFVLATGFIDYLFTSVFSQVMELLLKALGSGNQEDLIICWKVVMYVCT